MSESPFIYISALPRTGSTLLSEALSQLPYAFILHEPHLGRNHFALQLYDASRLEPYGVDLQAFVRRRLPVAFLFRRLRHFGYRQDFFLKAFKFRLLPALREHVKQIGVKEIRHMGWRYYRRHFPNMKVVMLGRDPRDIYLSYYRRWRAGNVAWRGPFTPETLTAFLNREFALQLALRRETECFKLRYEDLCTEETVIARVREFVKSPIPKLGEIGAFTGLHAARRPEHRTHGGKITSRRVLRWKKETDQGLLADAQRFFTLVPEYVEFWQYDARGRVWKA